MEKGRSWLTGTRLKYFAAALMALDYLNEFIFTEAMWMHWLGRLVAPIFI